MDRADREILRLLAGNGRLSYRELAEGVHLSANAVAERVRRLLDDGTIRAIRADINPAALNRMLEAQIDVKLRAGTRAEDFERELRLFPQLVCATLLTGTYDYLLRVACTDREELVAVTERLRNDAGAQETHSRIVLRDLTLSAWIG